MVVDVSCTRDGAEICPALPLDDVSRRVIYERQVVIVKSAVPAAALHELRAAIMAWAAEVAPMQHGTPLQHVGASANIHRIDDDPSRSSAPHLYHTFNFNDFATLPPRLGAACVAVFEPMRRLQNALTGNTPDFGGSDDPYRLRPQVIQYPRGGGFIASHRHPFVPQKLGLILNLSERGADYQSGGTRFDLPTGRVDIEGRHGPGDIAIFRYDLDHEVTPVDHDASLDWGLERGRWVAVLAYY